MILNGKDYKIGKITRAKNKKYTEIAEKVSLVDAKGEEYSEELLDEMVDVIVNLYDNQFTAEEINNEWDISDIVLAFISPKIEMADNLNEKVKPYQKKFQKK